MINLLIKNFIFKIPDSFILGVVGTNTSFFILVVYHMAMLISGDHFNFTFISCDSSLFIVVHCLTILISDKRFIFILHVL